MYTNKTTHCFIIICTYSVYIFVWFIGYSHEWMPEVRGGDDWREAGRCCWVYHGGDVVTSSLTCHILQILAVLRSKQGFCIYRWMKRRGAASVGVGVGGGGPDYGLRDSNLRSKFTVSNLAPWSIFFLFHVVTNIKMKCLASLSWKHG